MSELTKAQESRIQEVFQAQQLKAIELRKSTHAERIDKLSRLREWIKLNEDRICQALFEDFRKPKEEVILSEITIVQSEIKHASDSLKSWMAPTDVKTPLSLMGTQSTIYYEPKGTSLIIAPWNYPFNLMLGPLVSAIAAGCTAILKPSEMTPQTAKLISECIHELYIENEIAVFEGEVEVSQYLLSLPFDHIFFTGSPAVGKQIMKAAAEHLSSVTLELGGKSPAIVDHLADLEDAANKMVWGKFVNNGQTCIAPDYVLVDQRNVSALIDKISRNIEKAYGVGDAVQQSPDIARIVNQRHYQRLKSLLDDAIQKGAKVEIGGQIDEQENYMAPTVLSNVNDKMEIMQQEIFGPILPIMTFETKEEASDYVNSKPKPLALYVFSKSDVFADYFLENTSSGGVCINDSVIHFMNNNLPFGGVNNSGIGKSHGHFGFLAFSNEKAVLKQRVGVTGPKFLYPPYTGLKRKTIGLFKKVFG